MSFYRDRIQASAEFQRIRDIPRRQWREPELLKLTAEMTAVLKLPKGEQTLRPVQALALYEGGEQGGLLAPIPVGEGKTLISLLASYVVEAKTPLLLMPATLLDKTKRDQLEYSKHWRIPWNIHMTSIESMGRVSAADFLEGRLRPDLIIIDEAHRFKNKDAACTRRLLRYFAEYPETKLFAMSGTLERHSLKDWAHLSHFALKGNSPVPMHNGELLQWSEVLDAKAGLPCKTHPGALLELATPQERDAGLFRGARLAFQRRLMDTPGVVASKGADVGCSIYLNAHTFKTNPVTEEHFKKLRGKWRTPDDWPLMQAVDVWRHARELALGFYYAWSPRPPQEWLELRALWSKFVRKTLAYSRHLDSPKQVELAVLDGDLEDSLEVKEDGDTWTERDILARWKAVEDTFKQNTVIRWHDDSALNFCLHWGQKNRGIIWTDHSFFGRELAKRGGWHYFGQEGKNAAGVPIDLVDASHVGETIVASRQSNGTGRNLQHGWSRNLVVVPPGAADLEQLIARTHRPGQEADEVIVDMVFACAENLDAFTAALDGARTIQDIMGQKQKILMADRNVNISAMADLEGSRWTRTLSEKDVGFRLPTD